jgi:amino acid adenylation domain-containing protein
MQKAISGFQLAPQQKRLWQLQQNSSAFCSQSSISIEGNLQPEILQNAIGQIVDRHDILRTGFYRLPGVKTPVMVVADKNLFNWEYLDLSNCSQEDISTKIQELFWEARQKYQNLTQEPLFRLYLIKLSDTRHILIISLPALCADTRTIKNLVNQISQAYAQSYQDKAFSGKYVQYVQFSEWQNQLLEDEDAEESKEYWQQQTISSLSALKLPNERQGRNEQFVTDSYQLVISQELVDKIYYFGQKYDKTPEVILLACWQILIWRLTGESEIVIGTASDRRDYEELHDVLGLLATWLPIKTKFTPNLCFTEVLDLVAKTLENAAEWQDYFIPEAREENNILAFPIGFEWEKLPEKCSTAGVSFALDKLYSCIEPFKVKLSLTWSDRSLIAEFYYNVNYFSPETIQRLARQFQTLLNTAVTLPQTIISQLEILTPGDRQQLLFEFNQTRIDRTPAKCIHQLFAEQAAKTPDRIAVVYENEQLTYAQLNCKANQLANYLQTLGVKPEVVVGLCVERSLDMIIGLLAILKAGGAYLPLDPILPKESLSFRLQDAQAPILLTQHQLTDVLSIDVAQVVCIDTGWDTIAQCPDVNPISSTRTEDLVYVLFTSGSTGKPKGVAVEHRQLLNYVHGILDKLKLPDAANFAIISTIAADLGNTAIFPALCTGGCLHVISHERATNPEALLDYCARHPIDCLKIVPSHLNALLTASQPEKILPRSYLILGGEPLSWNLVEKIQQYAPNCQILNHYGPTEATVGVLTYSLNGEPIKEQSETVPLGRPLSNIQIYILDHHLQPVPIGVPGELHIGGDNLARGYLNQAELTKQKFVDNPFSDELGARLYKTGDLARYLPDGNIEFLGRIDQQVKIRGFRIELGEVESVLQQHPVIRETVVIAREDESGNKRLIAYFVLHQHTFAVTDLRNFLKQKLPDYMIPSAFVQLKKLPLTPNGKVDRQALPDPEQVRPELAEIFAPPRTPVEETIAKIWVQVLQIERVGINDNFFELGGDSIMTIQIAARANQAGIKVTPKQLFENPTVAGLAAVANISHSTQTKQDIVTGSLSRTSIDYSLLKQKLPAGLQTENIEDIYELTPIQKGILFHSLYAPELGLYLFQTRIALQGALNVDAFEQAWQQVVERHTILRTSFHWQDREQPLQVVYKQVKVPLKQQDWRGIDSNEQQRLLKSFLASDRASGFDLSQLPLMRLTLFRFGDEYYEFVWSRHFIIADGWSIPLILGEVVEIYDALCQGQDGYLAPSTPFRSYIEWLEQQDLSKAEGFWRHLLSNVKAPTPLTNLYVDRLSNQEEKYDDQEIRLSAETTEALHFFARQHQITVNTIVQGAWAFLLSRYSGQEEVVYGCTVSGRPPDLVGAESIVGMLVNTLPVRVKVDSQQHLLMWLRQLQAQLLDMRQYEYSSLVEIQAWSQVPRGLSLFDSIVVFENLPMPEALRDGHRSIRVLDSSNFYKTNYPLTVVVTPDSPLLIGINYDFNRVDIATINGILAHFNILLQNMVANPDSCLGDLGLLTEREQQITSMLEKEAIFDFCYRPVSVSQLQ